MSGWKLHKRSNTGEEYSRGTFRKEVRSLRRIFHLGEFIGGFAGSMDADASSTQTLSADNSVALFDAGGDMVDAVAWGTGTNPYVEGTPYPTIPAPDSCS